MIPCTPSEADFVAHRGPERWAALSISLLADSETPISIFRRLAGEDPDAVLLESMEGGELMGRYSFIVAGAAERFTFRDGRGCPKCADTKKCIKASDCKNGVCGSAGICLAATCTDTVKNGDETDVDCGGKSCNGCDVGKACLVHTDCKYHLCQSKVCTVTGSCKKLLSLNKAAPSGVILIQPSGQSKSIQVYCDMKTSGGGWTALLNPSTKGMSSPTYPGLGSSTKVLSGWQSCSSGTVPMKLSANGWHGLISYACGNVTFSLSVDWKNVLSATDVMFIAALQGQSTRKLTLEGADVTPNGFSNAYMKCAFWNGPGKWISPKLNECWKTALDVAPRLFINKLKGNLSITMTTGPGCSPDCKHGTGMNIQKLFVR